VRDPICRYWRTTGPILPHGERGAPQPRGGGCSMTPEVPVILALCVAVLSWQAPALDADGLSPLMRAAARGDAATVTSLVAAGAEVNAAHEALRLTPLMFAAYSGHDAVVQVLLDRGAIANLKDANGASAADWAAQGGHDGTAGVLARAGAQLNPFLNVGLLPFSLMDRAAGKPPGR
jgi:Ankyrin repeats (3 copies)